MLRSDWRIEAYNIYRRVRNWTVDLSIKRKLVFMGLLLLVLLILILVGGLPRWNYSRNWGYGPSSLLSVVVVVVVILLLLGYIPRGF